jgi:thiol-disulfide isomerase/thioredoxin
MNPQPKTPNHLSFLHSAPLTLLLCAGLAHANLAQPEEAPAPDPDPIALPSTPNSTSTPAPTPVTTPVAPAADSPAHAAVLASSAALRNATSLSFTISMQAEGSSIAQYTPTFTADVKMLRDPANRSTWLVRAKGSGRATPTEPETQFEVAWTANAIEWIDHKERKFYRRPTGSAKGKILQLAGASRVREFVEANPLSKILKAASFQQSGSENIDGVSCSIIDGLAKRSGSKDRIAIGPDNLPRRIEMIIESDMLAGRVSANYRSMRANDALDPSDLRLTPPDGYESDVVEPAPPAIPTSKPSPDPTDPSESAAPISAIPFTPPPTPVPVGPEPAPDVTLAVSGASEIEPLSLSSLKGNVVVLDFFGTWSLAARPAHAEIKDLLPRYQDKPVKFYSLAVREKSPDAAPAYFTKQGLDWGSHGGIVPSADSLVAPFRIRAYPTFCLINKDGFVVARIANFKRSTSTAYLAACIDALLDGKDIPPEPSEAAPESTVPDVKVTAPDGKVINAAGKPASGRAPTPPSVAAAAAAANSTNRAPSPPHSANSKPPSTPNHTPVGTPSNTIQPHTSPDSGIKKDSPKSK